MTILKIENLTKDFGHGRGIFDINFSIDRGEVLGFLGPNGAGKTTTIRHLMGFTKPEKGKAEILGMNATNQSAEIMKYVGYLPGEIALPEGLSGWEFIKMIKQMRKNVNESYLHKLINRFELDPQGNTKKMSLGVKRKLALVTAFMADPEVLILDEPTSGLDPVMQDQFIKFMIEEKNRGKTILLSSHIFKEVEAVCDRISIIKEGHLISEVDANKIRNKEIKKYHLFAKNQADLQKLSSKFKGKINSNNLELTIDIKQNELNNFLRQLADFQIKKITEEKFDLENYFLDLYRSNKKFAEV